MDVHADPDPDERDRRAGAARVRAEDDPDRHDRDRAGSFSRRSPSCGRSCCWARSINGRQVAGIADRRRAGCSAFVVVHQRGAVESRSRSVMKCDAASIAVGGSARSSSAAIGRARRARTPRPARRRRAGRRRGAPRAGRCRGPAPRAGSRRARPARRRPAARCHAAAASSAARAVVVRPSARRTRPRWTRPSAARRTSPVASALSIASSQRRGAGLVVAGLALRASEAGELVRLGLQEAEPAGRLGGATDVRDGIVEAVLEARQLAEHRVAADVQPRVVDDAQPVLDLVAGVERRARVAGRDRGAGGEERVRGLVPRPVEPVVELAGAGGQLQRLLPLAVVRDDVGEVVGAARLEVGVAGASAAAAAMCSRAGSRSTGRRLDPRREQQRGRAVRGAAAVAGGVERGQDPLRAAAVAEDDPRPAEPVGDVEREQRVVRRAPRERGVDVRALGAGEREVLGLARAAHALRRRCRGRRREPRRVRGEAALGQPGVGHRLERERADAVEQPVARSPSTITSERLGEPPDDVDRRRRRARRAPRAPTRPPRAARRRRTWRAPTGRAGRRGTAARSSTRSSPCSARRRSRLAAGRVAQHAEAVVEAAGDLLDRQRLRARRRELDRQRQAVERAAQLGRGLARRRAGGARRVNSSTASDERERRELEHGLAVDVERDLAGARGSAAPAPRRAGGPRAPRRRRRRARSCRGSSTAPAAPQPLEQRRLAAGDVQRGDHRVEDLVGGRARLRAGPARRCPRQRAAGRDRERRLADAAGPDDLDEPLAFASRSRERGDLRRRGRRARPTATAGSRAARGAERRSRG